jgi:hypothetical protein
VLDLSEMPPIPEKISSKKIIVYKSRVDPTIVKLTAEKMKAKLFARKKPEDVRVVSVDKYYEPYVLVDAKYCIKYFKKKSFSLDIDSDIENVKVGGFSYKPEIVDTNGEPHKMFKLEAELWSSYHDKTYLIFDKEGNEISPSQVPAAPSEDHPEKILAEFNRKDEEVAVSPEKGIEMVKERIVKRPSDVVKIVEELFQVSEHAVIYSPVYEITFRNVRSGEEKLVKIDGVTAKIVS